MTLGIEVNSVPEAGAGAGAGARASEREYLEINMPQFGN